MSLISSLISSHIKIFLLERFFYNHLYHPSVFRDLFLKSSIIFRRRLVRVYGFGSPVLQIIFAFKHVFIDIPKLMIYYLQDWRIGKLENRRILPDSSTGVLLKKIVLPSVNCQNKSNIDYKIYLDKKIMIMDRNQRGNHFLANSFFKATRLQPGSKSGEIHK